MFNFVVLTGRLVADPELKTTTSGISFLRFRIAVSRPYRKDSETQQSDFIDIVAWRNTAEFISKYFKKGSMIGVQGSIQTGSFTDKDGNKRYTFEVLANDVQFVDSKKDSQQGGTYAPTPTQTPAPTQEKPAASTQENTSFTNATPADFSNVGLEDDLPF